MVDGLAYQKRRGFLGVKMPVQFGVVDIFLIAIAIICVFVCVCFYLTEATANFLLCVFH